MNVIIAIHKEYADLIFEGKKTIEVRKGKMPHYCDRVFLYETKKEGGAALIVGLVLALGTAGGLDCETIGLAQGVAQLAASLALVTIGSTAAGIFY